MNWEYVHRVWALVWCPRKLRLGAQTLCMSLLLLAAMTYPARADCPAAPIADPDDMAISFLAANGVQAASASLLASSIKEGTLVYDDTADKLKVCDGTNWIDVGSGSGTDALGSLSCSAGQIAKYNGTAWACAADGGGGSGGPTPAFFAHRNSVNQSVTSSTWTKLLFTAETFDATSNFDTSTSRFTPNVAGRYIVSANVQCTDATSACAAAVYKNGVTITYNYSPGTGAIGSGATAVVDMNGSTDYLEAYAYNGGGTTIHGAYTVTNFSAALTGGGSDTLAGLSCATNEIPKWNGSAWACAADGGGAGTSAPGPYLRLSYSANALDRQNVIPFTVAESGGGAAWASNRFTAVTAGLYLATVDGFAMGQHNLGFVIRKNGSGIGWGYGDASLAGKPGGSGVTAVTYLNAGDYVDFYYTHDSPGIFLNTATASIAFIGGGSGGGSGDLGTDGFETISASVTANTLPSCGSYVCGYGSVTNCPAGSTILTTATTSTKHDWTNYGYNACAIDGNGIKAYFLGTSNPNYGTICTGICVKDDFGGGGSDTLSGLSCATNEIPKWNGTAWACATDGGGSASAGPGFYVHRNAVDQTVTSATWTLLNWTNEDFDSTNAFDLTTDRFTPAVAGRYQFNLNAFCSAGTQCSVMLKKNSADCTVATGYVAQGYNSGTAKLATTGAVLDLNGTTDYVAACVHNNGGTVISGAVYATNFSGALMGGGGSDTLSGLSCATNEIPKWNGSAWTCAADGGGDGSGSSIEGPSFSAFRSGNQTIATNTPSKVIFNTEEFDSNNNFDTTTGRYTPTVAGTYLLTANAYCPDSTIWCQVRIYRNGSEVVESGSQGGVDLPTTTALVQMNGTTDYVEAYVYNGGGTTVGGAAQWTRFSGFKIAGGDSDTLAGLSCSANEIPKWNGSAWACAPMAAAEALALALPCGRRPARVRWKTPDVRTDDAGYSGSFNHLYVGCGREGPGGRQRVAAHGCSRWHASDRAWVRRRWHDARPCPMGPANRGARRIWGGTCRFHHYECVRPDRRQPHHQACCRSMGRHARMRRRGWLSRQLQAVPPAIDCHL